MRRVANRGQLWRWSLPVRALENDAAVWLDFNQAWNPLCAYSPTSTAHATAEQLAAQRSRPVGEKVYAEH